MSKQTDINAKMRSILIDWLVEVHLKFKLMPETLYLTVNLIDRFLEKEQIMRNKLQLVGVTAMFMASKYEEIYAPECRDFVYISDKAYTRDEILRMEGLMLSRLNFQLTAPNAFVFIKRFAKVAGIATTPRSTTELLANYLLELTLQDYKMLKYLPSTICASAVYLALKTRGKTPWTPDLEKHSTYKEADLQACVRDIHELHEKATTNSLQAVRKKYTQEKHGNVSSIAPAHLGL
jgi:cyclin B